jgi:hypothetical protein
MANMVAMVSTHVLPKPKPKQSRKSSGQLRQQATLETTAAMLFQVAVLVLLMQEWKLTPILKSESVANYSLSFKR